MNSALLFHFLSQMTKCFLLHTPNKSQKLKMKSCCYTSW
uniref:Uncharacterized protein n=1 Tax=Anguilla anguilla TaxID=7936 RepID=A0A0E9Y034_ANGAN